MNYYTLTYYVEDHTKVAPLNFNQLEYLFRIYFGVLVLFLFLNMVHYALLRLAKPIKKLFRSIASIRLLGKWRVHPASQRN